MAVSERVQTLIGVEREAAGEVDGGGKRDDEGERGEGSVGGDGDVSELEKAGMHGGESGSAGVAIGVSPYFNQAAEEQSDGEADAEPFDEIHGIAPEVGDEAEDEAKGQRGETARKKPPFTGDFFHGAIFSGRRVLSKDRPTGPCSSAPVNPS